MRFGVGILAFFGHFFQKIGRNFKHTGPEQPLVKTKQKNILLLTVENLNEFFELSIL